MHVQLSIWYIIATHGDVAPMRLRANEALNQVEQHYTSVTALAAQCANTATARCPSQTKPPCSDQHLQ
eukprot:20214-Heterococcus_DN1.PRE.3